MSVRTPHCVACKPHISIVFNDPGRGPHSFDLVITVGEMVNRGWRMVSLALSFLSSSKLVFELVFTRLSNVVLGTNKL